MFFVLFFAVSLSSESLKFSNKNGRVEFTILQLTDLHLCKHAYLRRFFSIVRLKDDETFRILDELIQQTNPDLIVITGDIVSGDSLDGQDFIFEHCFERFHKFFELRKRPYSFVLGNHDMEALLNKPYSLQDKVVS